MFGLYRFEVRMVEDRLTVLAKNCVGVTADQHTETGRQLFQDVNAFRGYQVNDTTYVFAFNGPFITLPVASLAVTEQVNRPLYRRPPRKNDLHVLHTDLLQSGDNAVYGRT